MYQLAARNHAPRTQPPKTAPAPPTYQEIAALAYAYWEARGRAHGSDRDDWLRAERELLRRRGFPVR